MKIISVVVCILVALGTNAQLHTVTFPDELMADETNRQGFVQLYEVHSSKIKARGIDREIRFPDNFKARDTAFGTIYFKGYPGVLSSSHGILVASFTRNEYSVYVDRNNNFDFSDDGLPTQSEPTNSSAVLFLYNHKVPNGKFGVKLVRENLSQETLEMYHKAFRYEKQLEKGIPLLPADKWLYRTRLNTKIARVKIGADSAKIAIKDGNVNGVFGEKGKSLFQAVPIDGLINFSEKDGTITYTDSSYFSFNSTVYHLKDVDSLGRFAQFSASDKTIEEKLKPGDQIPELFLTTFEGDSIELNSFVDGQHYILFDVWGTWCKGCHAQAERIKDLHDNVGEKLTIVGVNTGDSKDAVAQFTNKYYHTWAQYKLTNEFIENFIVETYPTLILIAPDGKIVNMEIQTHVVEKTISGRN